ELRRDAQLVAADLIHTVNRTALDRAPQPFAAKLVEAVQQGADAFALGFSSMDVISGAGHDAVYLARAALAAMIFVPCK
ncbi:hypothetical protein SB677_21590, partial [Bacillus sp. SIMBA_033]